MALVLMGMTRVRRGAGEQIDMIMEVRLSERDKHDLLIPEHE